MITVCSRCKRVISETPPLDKKVSHGICSQCLEFLEDQIRQNQKCLESVAADAVITDERE